MTLISNSNNLLVLDIDYRENEFIKYLEDMKHLNNEIKLNTNISNLIIGDFIIKNNKNNDDNENNENDKNNENIEYIIERKTISDLCSSIIDGRFREQKNRLIESINDPSKIIYIIEGTKKSIPKKSKITKKIIDSAIINLIFKHRFNVFCTENIYDTFDIIYSFYNKINNDNNCFSNTVQNNCEIRPIKLIKKADNLNENVFINQLGVIPGVSINIAKKIKEHYLNMYELLKGFEKEKIEDKDPSLMLSNIQVSEKRKLGTALSKKIYFTLFSKLN